MQKQLENNQHLPSYKLSGNNSQITLADGSVFQLNIENAFLNFFEHLPKTIQMNELRTEILSIQDELMANMPDDYSMRNYKHMHNQLVAYSEFFAALFFKVKGGSNE